MPWNAPSHALGRIVPLLLLFFMLVSGSVKVWGQPVEITTVEDITNNTKKLYLIQTNAFQSFYMAPKTTSNTLRIMTNNILGNDMLWYFLDAGTDNGTQYYYIVNNSNNKYICHDGGTDANKRGVKLVDKDASNDERCKFYLVEDNSNGTIDFYNIDAKGKPAYYGLNKQNGSANPDNPIRLTNDQYINDANSKWKFIPYNGTFTWPDPPFTPSDDSDKHFYKIRNVTDNTYYVSTDATPEKVTFASTESDRMVWYLKEAGSDTWFKYYYIINPSTGDQYMYYNGTLTDGNEQTDAVSVKAYNSENEEDRYQFVVVQAARGDGAKRVECYAIMPKKLLVNLWSSNSLGPKAINDGANMGIIKSRGDTYAQWIFVSTGAWTDPGITCDETGTVTITCEAGAEVYYTTNGDTPTATESATNKKYNAPFTVNTGKTTINVRVIKSGKDNSNVVTKTIIYNPTTTLTAESFTYTGSAQNPVSSVDYVDVDNPENNIHFETAQYTIGYKKGDDAVPECINAGKYTIILNDVSGDDYIVCGTSSFIIGKKALTITADAKEKTYGDDDPTLTYTSEGLVGSDAITGALSRDAGENVGTYAINQNTLTASSNYTISYTGANFTITPKVLTVTAKPKTITYGDAPTNDGVLYSGFVEGENESKLTGTLAYAYNYSQYGDVGNTYTITPSGLTGDNYDISYVAGTLTVNHKEVGLVWSETTSFVYDANSHAPTATASGMVNGDEIGVTVSGEQINVGDYTATASELIGTKAGNYKLPIANTHAFSITKAPLTVTANNHSITYGDAPANNGVEYGGFVGGETSAVLGGSLDYDYSYTQYGDVGNTYTITPKDLTSTNYDITYNPGTLTVSQREIGLDWTNTELVYNGSELTPTATATGTVNDDAIAVTVIGTQTNAGEYTATASTLTGDKAGNYKLPIANTQTFTISPKSLGDGETAAEGITLDITTEGGNVVLNSVKDGETTLVNNTDYTYDIQDEASDKIIAIAGIGNYTGSISGVYVCPVFTDADGEGAGLAAAVYQARRDFASPTGVNAYIVRSVNPTIGTLTISKLEYIPKDVPVLLLTASQASGFLTAEKDESTPAVSVGTVNSNMLKVAPTGGVAVKSAEVYMFYLGEFVLAKEGTVKAGKFYVHNPNFTATPEEPGNQGGSNSRRTLQFVIDDDVTGLLELKNSSIEELKTDVWYTLDGRRLSGKPTKGGIYILKGQKVIIKRK